MIKISKIKVAAYIRISKREKENNSIINQKDLINYYVSMNNDMDIYSYYIDDGYSGTDFNRPELKKMLKEKNSNEQEKSCAGMNINWVILFYGNTSKNVDISNFL